MIYAQSTSPDDNLSSHNRLKMSLPLQMPISKREIVPEKLNDDK